MSKIHDSNGNLFDLIDLIRIVLVDLQVSDHVLDIFFDDFGVAF